MPSNTKDKVVTTLTEDHECPGCGAVLNAATGTDSESVPREGDISVCYKCGSLLEFNEDLSVRLLDSSDMKKLDWETVEELEKIQEFIRGNRAGFH